MLRLLVCSSDSEKAKNIYLNSVDILKSLNIKCELTYTNSADAFPEGKNSRNQPYDILILDAYDIECIKLASSIRTKNLMVSIIFFNASADLKLKEMVRYRPSYATLLSENNKDLCKALKWCCKEQLRAHPYFTVKNKDVQMRIPYDTISYFESKQRIVVLHTPQQAIEFYAKLSDVYSTLPADDFVRCHQSFIVNMNKVRLLDKANRLFILQSGANIEISKSQYSYVMTEYEKFTANH